MPASIDAVRVGDRTEHAERQSIGIPQRHSRRGRARPAELRAGRTDLDPRLRRALDVRRARRAPLHRRHSGDDAGRPGPGFAFQSRFGRSHRSAARPVLGAVRKFVGRRDPVFHGRRQRNPEWIGGIVGRATTRSVRERERARFGGRSITTSISPISKPTATATTGRAARIGQRQNQHQRRRRGQADAAVQYGNIAGAQDPLGLTRAQFEADPRSSRRSPSCSTRARACSNRRAARSTSRTSSEPDAARDGLLRSARRQQYLAIPVATQGNPLHPGGVVDLDGKYGGTDARWIWKGDLAGRPFEMAAGINYDGRTSIGAATRTSSATRSACRAPCAATKGRRSRFRPVRAGDWQFADAWSLTAGVRHSDVKFNPDDHYITATNPDDSGNVDYSATTPVAGLMWRASDAALLRLVRQGIRNADVQRARLSGRRTAGSHSISFRRKAGTAKSVPSSARKRWRFDVALFQADTRNELTIATNRAAAQPTRTSTRHAVVASKQSSPIRSPTAGTSNRHIPISMRPSNRRS